MNLLELINISCHFGAVKAVDNVSLTVKKGQFITLLGPSGCGKTTTLRLIAGFETPTSGSIRFKERVFVDTAMQQFVPPKDRHIGMVFQDYALFPHLNVAQNISFGLHTQSKVEKAQRTQEMLELVGLTGLDQRMPFALSGGQQQRVALARALAPQPDMLLLDEPFSNLDAALRAQLRSEMAAILRKANTTCVFVTHAQDEALSLSDKIAVMFAGKIDQLATPEQLYEAPATLQIATFIGEANIIQGEADGDTVQTFIGRLPLASPAHGRVQVVIRPEWITPAAQDTVGQFNAGVQWTEYYGHDRKVGVTVDAHSLDTADVLRTEHGNSHSAENQLIARMTTAHPVQLGDTLALTVNHPVLAYPL